MGVQHKIDKQDATPVSNDAAASVSASMEAHGGDNNDDDAKPVAVQSYHSKIIDVDTKPAPMEVYSGAKPMEFIRNDAAVMMEADDLDAVDWAELTNALEGDFREFELFEGPMDTVDEEEASNTDLFSADTSSTTLEHSETKLTYLEQFFTSPPREFVVRTIRSEVIDLLLKNGGDVTDAKFLQGLEILAELFKSSVQSNVSKSPVLNGCWRSISRPMYHYGGCVGANERGDFVYTLGKMCFNMFKPGNVRVTVQHTMNHIEPVCRMDKLPTAAPWSLRRELALQEPEALQNPSNTMLKSYDVVVALTIEPGRFAAAKNEEVPAPARRLKALQVARGYFLPDPETNNRLTVWFTGGDLAPAPLTDEDYANGYGGLQDWIDFFGGEYTRTWGEAISDMGAKLFLGAELPNEMDPNGKLEYTLHRPYGGHGKGHADVMYVDGELLITKGQSGSLHVMVAQK